MIRKIYLHSAAETECICMTSPISNKFRLFSCRPKQFCIYNNFRFEVFFDWYCNLPFENTYCVYVDILNLNQSIDGYRVSDKFFRTQIIVRQYFTREKFSLIFLIRIKREAFIRSCYYILNH